MTWFYLVVSDNISKYYLHPDLKFPIFKERFYLKVLKTSQVNTLQLIFNICFSFTLPCFN